MSDIWAFVAARPWIWLVLAIGLAIWIWAIRTIFTSDKFLRKWLWLLLTFVSFSISWPVGDGATFGIGLPLGAAYVLWFARWGRAPTDEERARRAAKTALPMSVSARKVLILRIAYGAFAIAILVQSVWAIAGPFGRMFELMGGAPPPGFMETFYVGAALMTSFFLGLCGFLAWRPYWWGKLLCALAAVSWIGHAAISGFVLPDVFGPDFPAAIHAAVVGGAGLVALATGLAHQWADPRFGGTYLRVA